MCLIKKWFKNESKKITCFEIIRREFYVHVLKQHSRIDIFGKCGKPFCSFDQLNDCYQRIEIDYKFYLSFENSLCRDYITEKFFNLLDRNIVPIVYGAGNYESIAPPHSYIDALKYTPVQLAKYLDILDKNDTLYNEYFWWKPFYKWVGSKLFQSSSKNCFFYFCLILLWTDHITITKRWQTLRFVSFVNSSINLEHIFNGIMTSTRGMTGVTTATSRIASKYL
jgi:hypothetical protein